MDITKRAIVNASADEVWRVVAHEFDRIGSWATAVPVSRASDDGPELTGCPVWGRTCQTSMGMFPEVQERIVAYDEAHRTLTYEPIGGTPGFIATARNTWRVVAVDERRSEVSFAAVVTAHGIAGPLLAVAMRLMLTRAGGQVLDDLSDYVEHGRPTPRKQRQLDRGWASKHRGAGSRRVA
jgi:hypothetical protein